MVKPRYSDPYEDPTYDPEDDVYGDYEVEDGDGFYIFDIYSTTDDEDPDDE
jgi:hypothetical protein